MGKLSLLSSPIKVNEYTVKNRIVVPPMADFGATNTDDLVNKRHLKHYGELSKGGAGLIIIEACSVCKTHEKRNTVGVFDDSCIRGLSALAKSAKQNDTIVLVQLLNAGIDFLPYKTIEEIPLEMFIKYKQQFVDAAIRCKKAGFDGVELHAAHGYYLNQIIEMNHRNDQYGGTFECRIRLLVELIQEIRNHCGNNFIIAVRFGNRNIEELVATGKAIEKAGGDLLDVSTGFSVYQKPQGFPLDHRIFAASCVKKNVSLPVVCVGNIDNGKIAEEILEKGYADLVAVGKGHLCDPYWGDKVLHDKELTKCFHCKNCMWFIDGEKCPAVRIRRKEEKI